MAKLVFKYGVMGSGKTLSLLKEAYNYEKVGKSVVTFAPEKDDRNGVGVIKASSGWKRDAIVIGENSSVKDYIINLETKPDAIFVDEAQFFKEEQIFDLAWIANTMNIPVFCYGLLTDFRCELFEGSKALTKCASQIITETTVCECGSDAVVNMRVIDGTVVTEGDQVAIGNVGSMYYPVCHTCYKKYCSGEKKLPQRFMKTS